MSIKAKEHCCEEASPLSTNGYIPCNRPATRLVAHGDEGPYRMCDACADHNLKNRGAEDRGPYVARKDGAAALSSALWIFNDAVIRLMLADAALFMRDASDPANEISISSAAEALAIHDAIAEEIQKRSATISMDPETGRFSRTITPKPEDPA